MENWDSFNLGNKEMIVTPAGLLAGHQFANGWNARGLKSKVQFSRANLIILVRYLASLTNSYSPFLGFGTHLPNESGLTSLNGIYISNGNFYGATFTSPGVTSSLQAFASGVLSSSRLCADVVVAFKLLPTGARGRVKIPGETGWTADSPAGVTLSHDPANLVIQSPFHGSVPWTIQGLIAEQSDGEFTDQKLDAILEASNLFGAYDYRPVADVDQARTIFSGQPATVTLALSNSWRRQPGISSNQVLCQLIANGQAPITKILNGSSFVEIDPVNAPGFYRLSLSSIETAALGDLIVLLRPTHSQFIPVAARCQVQAEAPNYHPRFNDLDNAVEALSNAQDAEFAALENHLSTQDVSIVSVAGDAALLRKFKTNQISTSGTGLATLHDDDDSPLMTQQLRDGSGAPLALPTDAFRQQDKAVLL